jgi:hypothetical protein
MSVPKKGIVHVAVALVIAASVAIGVGDALSGGAKLKGNYVGQKTPGSEPQLFAPGFVSTGLYERDVAMTPDGGEFYFGLLSSGYATIVVTKRIGDEWTDPEIAPFSANAEYLDLEPHITPDGRRLMFLSTRPREGQEYQAGWANQDIWVADRTERGGWSEPYNLGPPVNTDAAEFYPSVTRDGTIYFTRDVNEEGQRKSFIFRARMVDGVYAEPERLPEQVNPGDTQYNAFIDPDERYLIVCIAGLPDAIGRGDYYVSFRFDDDTWTGPVNMGDKINTPGNSAPSPYVSPDGRYFFFASTRKIHGDAESNERRYADIRRRQTEPGNGNSDVYWVDASFIEALRP